MTTARIQRSLATVVLAGLLSTLGVVAAAPAAAADTATVAGVISDADTGLPIAGAEVRFFPTDSSDNQVTTSSGSGAYTFTNLPVGTATIGVTKAGYVHNEQRIVIATEGSNQTFDIELAVGSVTISGTITDGMGQPVAGPGFDIQTDDYSVQGPGSTYDPATGAYSVSGLVPGDYTVTFGLAPSWEPQTKTVTVTAGQTATVDFQLLPRTSNTVTATIEDESGGKVQWLCVSVWDAGTGQQISPETNSRGMTGTYIFRSVPSGTHTIRVRDCDTTRMPTFGTTWLGGAMTLQAASTFTVGTAQTATVGPIVLVPRAGVIEPVTPTITGVPQVDEVLELETGTWEPFELVNLFAQWNSNGVPIPNEEGSALLLTEDLVDTVITVTVTGQASGYDPVTLTSEPTAPVAPVFADISTDHFFNEQIVWMRTTGISNGYIEPSGLRTYHPLEDVSRQAMAAFLYRLAGSPSFNPPATPTFADVPSGALFFKEIEWMKAEGITNGNVGPGGTLLYLPLDSVSRQAMSAFLYRLNGSPSYTPPAVASFPDVPVGSAFYKEVEWMKSVAITTGYPDGYHPVENVSRQSMAVFLYRYAHMLPTTG